MGRVATDEENSGLENLEETETKEAGEKEEATDGS